MERTELQTAPRGGVDSFALKLIAIFGMTLDHIGVVFGQWLPLWAESALYALGGLTFPIMAFLLCEGFRHTRSKGKYALRLLVFALITQIPYMWALMSQLNVLFTLLLGLLALMVMEKVKNPLLCGLVAIVFTVGSLFCDWGLMGVPMVLIYYYVQDPKMKPVLGVLPPVMSMGANGLYALAMGYMEVLPSTLFVFVGCTLTIPLLANYNGQRGRPMKYLFYAYYPLHIIVLGVLRGLIFGYWGSIFGIPLGGAA